MSFTLLGILNSQASGVAQTYFLNLLGAATDDRGYAIDVDSNGNVYLAGETDPATPGGDDFLVASLDSDGIIRWQKILGGASREIAYGAATDSNNNLYVAGKTESTGEGDDDWLIAKYNSSGTLQWQRAFGGLLFDNAQAVAIDPSDNIYITGYGVLAGNSVQDLVVIKYDTSGLLQWQKALGDNDDSIGRSITTDSSLNVYVVGESKSLYSNTVFLVTKYNSSGTLQWQRAFGNGTADTSARGVAVDSIGNIYVGGRTEESGQGSVDFILTKYNSSGTLQWQRTLGSSDAEFLSLTGQNGVAIDSDGNPYIAGFTFSSGVDGVIAKFDSLGNLVWQRFLGSSSSEVLESLAIDSNDNIHVTGRSSLGADGKPDFFTAKLPSDGSLEGSYDLNGNTVEYVAGNLTVGTSTLATPTISLSASTPSFTSAVSSLSEVTPTYTSITTEIG